MADELDDRWDFLFPWCEALCNRISYVWPDREEEVWDVGERRFEVELPTRRDEDRGGFIYCDEDEFQTHLQQLREALALLAAVAHVDQAAWKYLLEDCCGVELRDIGGRKIEEEIPARFVLVVLERNENKFYPETLKADLVQFCGAHQRTDSSAGYTDALKRIAALDETLQLNEPGVDVQVPVQMWFHIRRSRGWMTKTTKPLEDIQSAAAEIQRSWEGYGHTAVEPGSLRCTLMLEPTISVFGDYTITPNVAQSVERLVSENAWFAQFSLWVTLDRELRSGELPAVKAMGQLMGSLFDSERRPYGLTSTKYQRGFETRPLQMGTIHLEFASWLESRDVEAMFSAIAVCQTARKLSMSVNMPSTDPEASRRWWKWMAYALFSERTRRCSSVESLALTSIAAMSTEDVEAFAGVLASDHQEEDLFGCHLGALKARDATLKEGASIYFQMNYRGSPRRESRIPLSSAIGRIRCFSDDGTSKWVNALVPGYGRCVVSRGDLIFDEASGVNDGEPCSVTSLKIGFEKEDDELDEFPTVSTGLPRFLELVGPQLKVLTLDGPRVELSMDSILKSCPQLEELSVCGYFVAVKLDLSEYRSRNPLPASFNCQWEDIAALTAALSDSDSPVAKCVRRLQVRLMDRELGWGANPHNYDPQNFETHAEVLLLMLEVNRSLEYLDVVAPSSAAFADMFKRHHRTPISRSIKLELETKLAFLSVVSARRTPLAADKKRKQFSSQTRSTLGQLDQHVLANIFALAATPVLREVHFREPRADDWEEERVHGRV